VLRQKEAGVPAKRMLQFKLEDPEPLLYHNEPVYKDGAIVGYTSSGNYGHFLGGAIGLGYVKREGGVSADWIGSGGWEIEVAGTRIPASASLRPMYDPRAERVKV